ncbi:MAG: hypothetical protein MUE81_08090 [Thermoflexibacter sp.]|nr:hypothetical protein [Thermoflexibacter sp.]
MQFFEACLANIADKSVYRKAPNLSKFDALGTISSGVSAKILDNQKSYVFDTLLVQVMALSKCV